jgi:hypothetical protein
LGCYGNGGFEEKTAITDHFSPSTKRQQQVLAELPVVQAEPIQFHSYSKSNGHSYLSNMFPCVRFFRYGMPRVAPFSDSRGVVYDSVERFYQYHRFLAMDERYANEVILLAADAKAVASATGVATKNGGSSKEEVQSQSFWRIRVALIKMRLCEKGCG